MTERNARIDLKKDGERFLVSVSGTIDESFDPSFLKQLPKGGTIVFNLKAVHRVNSMGMLAWRNLMREIQSVSDSVFVLECSPMMVGHTSTVLGFMGRAVILSVVVPYVCEACGTSKDLVSKTPEIELNAAPPCEKCGRSMVLDDPPETYLGIPSNNLPSSERAQPRAQR